MKLLMSISLLLASSAWADGLSFQFKSPSFSGAGQSAHYLTIDEQERSRKIAIQDEVEARLNELEGNQIAFVNTGTEIVLTVTDVDGAITEIRIPIGTFGICSAECGI